MRHHWRCAPDALLRKSRRWVEICDGSKSPKRNSER
jgi:hypothetical protein